MGSDPRESRGPSWYDVERHLLDLEKRLGRHVRVELHHTADKMRGGVYWTAYVCVVGARPGKPQAVHGGSYPFRGKGGASTVTAALVLALYRLEEQLDQDESEAAQQALF